MSKFNTKYDRQQSLPEKNSGKTKVETAGYVSPKRRIEALLNAGMRLQQARKENYDFPDGKIDHNFFDPTRRKDYDMVDAFQDSQNLKARVKSSQTAQESSQEVKNLKYDKIDSEDKKSNEEAVKP